MVYHAPDMVRFIDVRDGSIESFSRPADDFRSAPVNGHREEPRSLRQPGRGHRLQRGEEVAEERRPAATGYAAVVEHPAIRRQSGAR